MTRDLYTGYPNDARHMADYIAYQQRYAGTVRESDRRILAYVADVVQAHGPEGRLLDIGCSTGNLLRHLKGAFPGLTLAGGDLSEMQLAACREDPDLAGIAFESIDILEIDRFSTFDVITANAILYGLGAEDFERAAASLAGALRPGGTLIAFDFFHPFDQEVAIVERSAAFPDGHPLHFRSYGWTRSVLASAGFAEPAFHPFAIPIDLPMPGLDSIRTYTRRDAEGARLQFRGTLFQPWCHLVARRA